MQLKDIKKEGIFTTLYYELTWKIGWEQLLSILDVVIRTDFQEKGFQSLAVGMIAGTSPQDVTRDVLANGGDIRRSAFAKGESGYAVLTGYSHLMKVTMRIIVWNQSDRFMLQLADDRAIGKDGKHSYDKYADSIEILAHIDYAKKLLVDMDMSVALIASKVGYENFTNFTQMFRKYTGTTPTEYRKKYQKNGQP